MVYFLKYVVRNFKFCYEKVFECFIFFNGEVNIIEQIYQFVGKKE